MNFFKTTSAIILAAANAKSYALFNELKSQAIRIEIFLSQNLQNLKQEDWFCAFRKPYHKVIVALQSRIFEVSLLKNSTIISILSELGISDINPESFSNPSILLDWAEGAAKEYEAWGNAYNKENIDGLASKLITLFRRKDYTAIKDLLRLYNVNVDSTITEVDVGDRLVPNIGALMGHILKPVEEDEYFSQKRERLANIGLVNMKNVANILKFMVQKDVCLFDQSKVYFATDEMLQEKGVLPKDEAFYEVGGVYYISQKIVEGAYFAPWMRDFFISKDALFEKVYDQIAVLKQDFCKIKALYPQAKNSWAEITQYFVNPSQAFGNMIEKDPRLSHIQVGDLSDEQKLQLLIDIAQKRFWDLQNLNLQLRKLISEEAAGNSYMGGIVYLLKNGIRSPQPGINKKIAEYFLSEGFWDVYKEAKEMLAELDFLKEKYETLQKFSQAIKDICKAGISADNFDEQFPFFNQLILENYPHYLDFVENDNRQGLIMLKQGFREKIELVSDSLRNAESSKQLKDILSLMYSNIDLALSLDTVLKTKFAEIKDLAIDAPRIQECLSNLLDLSKSKTFDAQICKLFSKKLNKAINAFFEMHVEKGLQALHDSGLDYRKFLKHVDDVFKPFQGIPEIKKIAEERIEEFLNLLEKNML